MKPGTAVLAALSLLAFAGNSLVARAALAGGDIDAASFSLVRLGAGSLALGLILGLRRRKPPSAMAGSWRAALALFVYAAAFSWAYLSLEAGTGALLLFGAVQLSMLLGGRLRGERFAVLQRFGLLVSLAGLVYLQWPGLGAPPLLPALGMLLAGLAWGVYSLAGRGSGDPLAATAGNFGRSLLPAGLLAIAFAASQAIHWSAATIGLALLSGGLLSGPAYVLWYAVLPRIGAGQAAALQLLVPVLAALGGVLLLGESASLRLLLAGVLIVGGIALTLRRRAG